MLRLPLALVLPALLLLPPAPQRTTQDEPQHSLERLARGALDDGAQGLALALDTGGKLVFAGGWGVADAHGARVDADTAFSVGPLLGSFLGVAALRLAERGSLDLDAPVARFLPELYAEHPELTLDRLLTHTSGLPSYGELLRAKHMLAAFPAQAILAWLAGAPLDAQPGSCAAYTDTDEFLLGLALEKAAGKELRELLRREVFEPAGMADTRWVFEPSELVESAHLDQEFAGGEAELVDAPPPFDADLLHSTVLDLVRFQRALLGAQLLNPASRARRLEAARLLDGTAVSSARGVNLTALGDLPRHAAGGGMAGQRVHLAYYPTMDTTIAVLARGPDAPLEALERSVARTLFDLEPKAPRDLPLSAAERALFLGDYYAGCTSYGITESGARLVLVLPNGERVELLNQGEARFLARGEPDLAVQFELDDGRAVAFELTQRGVTLRAMRLG